VSTRAALLRPQDLEGRHSKTITTKEKKDINPADIVSNWISATFTLALLRKIAGVGTTNASEGHHSSVSRKIPKANNNAQGRDLMCKQFLASMVHFEGEVWLPREVRPQSAGIWYDRYGWRCDHDGYQQRQTAAGLYTGTETASLTPLTTLTSQ
jgi:hypothetical protein